MIKARIFFLFFFTLFFNESFCVGASGNGQTKLQQYTRRSERIYATTLKDFVEHYSVRTKEYAEKNLSRNNSHENELMYIANSVEACSSVRQCMVLLARMGTLDQKIVDRDLSKELSKEKAEATEKIKCALLLQSSMIVSEIARSQLLEALRVIDIYLSYWYGQKNKPTYYFFHKSPLKWVTGTDQATEIRDNIQGLEQMQKELFTYLGMLVTHLYSFDGESDIADYYTWIDILLSKIPCGTINEDKISDDVLEVKINKRLQYKLRHVHGIKNNVLSLISSAKKPHHFVRNWMLYSATFAAAAGLVYYAYQNPKLIDALLEQQKKAKESITGLVHDSIVTPAKNSWEVLLGQNNADEEKFLQEKIKEIKSIHEELNNIELTSNIEEGIAKASKSINDSVLKLIPELLTKLEAGGAITSDRKNEVLKAVKDGDGAPLMELYNELSVLQLAVWNIGNNISNKTDSLILSALVSVGQVLKSVHELASKIDHDIMPTTRSTAKLIGELADFSQYELKKVYEFMKQNRLTMQCTFLIPLFSATWAATWAMRKIHGKFTRRNYAPLRVALAEVQSFFIESQSSLSEQGYGKLVYLLHKLKNKAIYHISTKDNVQHDFLKDVVKLESKEFTVDTKRHIIDNMRSRYPFLSVVV